MLKFNPVFFYEKMNDFYSTEYPAYQIKHWGNTGEKCAKVAKMKEIHSSHVKTRAQGVV